MRKGWFKIPDVQEGDRELSEQMTGLDKLLPIVRGRSVLDLGCAEGLISRQLIEAGAASITGVEIVADSADEARRQLMHFGNAQVFCGDIDDALKFFGGSFGALRFDVVIALAILHKLKDPAAGLHAIGQVTNRCAVIRTAGATPGFVQDGRSNHINVPIVPLLAEHGLTLRAVTEGPRAEWTGYFYRSGRE